MDATLNDEKLDKIIGLIDEMKGQETVCLNVRGLCSWTDYMIITTVTSFSHMKGISRRLKDLFFEQNWELINNGGFAPQEEWTLIDSNDVIIHLMSLEARQFYELENRWFEAEKLCQSSSSS